MQTHRAISDPLTPAPPVRDPGTASSPYSLSRYSGEGAGSFFEERRPGIKPAHGRASETPPARTPHTRRTAPRPPEEQRATGREVRQLLRASATRRRHRPYATRARRVVLLALGVLGGDRGLFSLKKGGRGASQPSQIDEKRQQIN